MKIVTLIVNSNPLLLGEAATDEDVVTYANNLSHEINDTFGVDTHIRYVRGGHTITDDDDVNNWLLDQIQGDSWIRFLESND